MTCVGTVRLFSEDRHPIISEVTKLKVGNVPDSPLNTFEIHDTSTKRLLGTINAVAFVPTYITIANLQNETQKLKDGHVYGIGTKLVDCAVSWSLESDRGGRVHVFVTGSHFFYRDLDFEISEFENADIKSDIERFDGAEKEYRDLVPGKRLRLGLRKEREALAKERGVPVDDVPIKDLFLMPIGQHLEISYQRAKAQKMRLPSLKKGVYMVLSPLGIQRSKDRILNSSFAITDPLRDRLQQEYLSHFHTAPQQIKDLIIDFASN